MNNFTDLHLRENAKIVSKSVPGEQSRKLLAFQNNQEGTIVSYPRDMPIAFKRAKGAIIEDLDGNCFIDFFSCAGVLNVGHGNPFVLDYVNKQQEDLIHALDFPTVNKQDLILKILSQIPQNIRGDYKVSFCGPSGSDAIEAALKLAKHKTGRQGIIAFQGSYHGMTSGALSVTSNVRLREKINSLVPNISFIPYSYCYRCPFKLNTNNCQLFCADYLEYILNNPHSGIEKPAAIVIEPIQGEGGTVIPKAGFLKKIVSIAKENNIIVIFDEIQSGFYRSGKFWSFQYEEVFPDIILMSKGLGGIGFPISAIIYNKNIESWGPGDHIGTFRCNQVSIAAGNGAFDFIKKYKVEQHVVNMGEYLMEKLRSLTSTFPFVGEIRGRGLFFGIEYVKDQSSKNPAPDIAKNIKKNCFKNGLLIELGGNYNNVIRFIPPLIVNKAIIDNALFVFEKVNMEILKKYIGQNKTYGIIK